MKQDSEIFARGILAGAIVDTLQLSTGPGNIFLRVWDTLEKALDKRGEVAKSYKQLCYCHWCLTPYVAFLLWLPDRLGGFWGLLYMIGIGSITASAGKRS
jgi:hypothetical protein